MKPTTNYGLSDSLIDAVRKSVEEAKLHPNQQKLDVHEPEKDELTSQDFKKLRAGKKVKDDIDTKPKLKEEDEQIDELSVNKMLKYTDAANKNREVLNKKWDTGTATEPEKNKVLGHERGVDSAAARVKAKTGKNPNEIGKLSRMKYAVTKEEEQIDELSNKTYFAAYKAADRKTGSAAIERDGGFRGKHLRTKELAYKGVKRNNAKQMGQQAEDIEQMDEAPLRTVNALVGYPKLNKKVAAKGTPGSEDERNKAAAGLRRDRSGLGRRAYTGDQHYDVRREEYEQIDELSVNKMLKYTDAANKNREVLNKKWDTGTATEPEKNKVLGHERGVDSAAARVKAKTGKNPNEIGKLSRMKYAVTKEEEQIDELSNKTYFAAYKAADRKTGSAAIERDGGFRGKHLRTKELAYKGVKRNNAKQMGQQAEDIEQMDEAPLRAVSALVGYPKLDIKIAKKGTPGAEHERNKAAAGLRDGRSGLGRRAYTGDQHYDVRREDIEQMDEISSELAGRASNARIDRNMSKPMSSTDLRKVKKGGMTPPEQQRKTTAGYMKTLDRKNEEYEQMDEIKLADLPRRKVMGKSYGADYDDPEGADETAADMKKAEPKRKSGPQGTMKRRFSTKSYEKIKGKLKAQY